MIFEIAARIGGGLGTIRELWDCDIDSLFELYGYIRYENLSREFAMLKGRGLAKLKGPDKARYYELLGMFEGEEVAKEQQSFEQDINMANLLLGGF